MDMSITIFDANLICNILAELPPQSQAHLPAPCVSATPCSCHHRMLPLPLQWLPRVPQCLAMRRQRWFTRLHAGRGGCQQSELGQYAVVPRPSAHVARERNGKGCVCVWGGGQGDSSKGFGLIEDRTTHRVRCLIACREVLRGKKNKHPTCILPFVITMFIKSHINYPTMCILLDPSVSQTPNIPPTHPPTRAPILTLPPNTYT